VHAGLAALAVLSVVALLVVAEARVAELRKAVLVLCAARRDARRVEANAPEATIGIPRASLFSRGGAAFAVARARLGEPLAADAAAFARRARRLVLAQTAEVLFAFARDAPSLDASRVVAALAVRRAALGPTRAVDARLVGSAWVRERVAPLRLFRGGR